MPSLLIAAVVLLSDATLDLRIPRNAMDYGLVEKLAAVLLAPPLETACMLVVYYCLGLLVWRNAGLRIAILAVLSALIHLAAGGWLHVIGVLWVFAVLSVALGAWQARRARDAFVVVTSIHMLHNATILALHEIVQRFAA